MKKIAKKIATMINKTIMDLSNTPYFSTDAREVLSFLFL
jgi:hypothetical protein